MKIGFLINPVAGMGGAVGLKGTDGQHQKALSLGASPVASKRALLFLKGLSGGNRFVTVSGEMGEDALRDAGITDYQVVYSPAGETSADDTRNACRLFLDAGIDLLVFCGGDGTARDVSAVIGQKVPLLGIPAGVKMYSGVFAVTPRAGAEVVNRFDEAACFSSEVMDVDEEAYRTGQLLTSVYGIARVPTLPERTQSCKWVAATGSEERDHSDIAQFITEIMSEGILYIIGAGTTTQAVTDLLGEESTLLGVDAVLDRRVIGRDLNEAALLALLEKHPRAKIIISPIGAQGFVFGRGNQQISAEVLRKAGTGNVVVVATPAKMSMTPNLYIDTGSPGLNREFGDSVAVITGYRMAQRKRVITEGV